MIGRVHNESVGVAVARFGLAGPEPVSGHAGAGSLISQLANRQEGSLQRKDRERCCGEPEPSENLWAWESVESMIPNTRADIAQSVRTARYGS